MKDALTDAWFPGIGCRNYVESFQPRCNSLFDGRKHGARVPQVDSREQGASLSAVDMHVITCIIGGNESHKSRAKNKNPAIPGQLSGGRCEARAS